MSSNSTNSYSSSSTAIGPSKPALPESSEMLQSSLKTQVAVDELFGSLKVDREWTHTHRNLTKELIRWVEKNPEQWGSLAKVFIVCQSNRTFQELFIEVIREESTNGHSSEKLPFLIEALYRLSEQPSALLQLGPPLAHVLECWLEINPKSPQFLAILAKCVATDFFAEPKNRFEEVLKKVLQKDVPEPFAILNTCKQFALKGYEVLIANSASNCLAYLIQSNDVNFAEIKVGASSFLIRAASQLDSPEYNPRWQDPSENLPEKIRKAEHFLKILICGKVDLPPSSSVSSSSSFTSYSGSASSSTPQKRINALRPLAAIAQQLRTNSDEVEIKTLIDNHFREFLDWLQSSPLATDWMRKHRSLAPFIFESLLTKSPHNASTAILSFLVKEGGLDLKVDGLSHLIKAINSKSEPLFSFLLTHNPEVINQIDPASGMRPFECAAKTGNLPFCTQLLGAGADSNAPFKENISALEFFLQNPLIPKKEAIATLIRFGFDLVNHKPLDLSAFIETDFLILLLDAGIDITHTSGPHKNTLLHTLILARDVRKHLGSKYLALIESLLAHRQGRHIALQPNDEATIIHTSQKTPLMMAIDSRQLEVIALLLLVGADPETRLPSMIDTATALVFDLFRHRNPTPFTLKKVANLVGDDFIFGMKDAHGITLEGMRPLEAIELLIDSLQEESVQQLNAEENKEIQELVKKLRQTRFFLNCLEHLAMDEDSPSSLRKIIEQLFVQHLRALQPGEKTLLPWGWIDGRGGHAMLAIFERRQDRTFTLSVVNTIRDQGYYHIEHFNGVKVQTHPLIQYQGITLEEMIQSDFFQAFMASKIDCPREGYERYEMTDLYGGVLERFASKRVAIANQDLTAFIQTQSAGTCTYRCLMAFAQHFLGKSLYKQVKHKVYLLNAQHALQLPADRVQQEILARTTQNLARQVRKLLEASPPYKEAILSLSIIRQLKEGVTVSSLAVAAPKPLELIYTETGNKRQIKFIDAQQPPKRLEPAPLQDRILTNDRPPIQSANLITYLQELNQWAEKKINGRETALAEAIIDLPLPEGGVASAGKVFNDPWSKIPPADIPECLNQLQKLRKNYLNSMDRKSIYSFDTALALHHASALFWRLSIQLDAVEDLKPEIHLSYYGISDAPLKALKEHIHLLPFSPEREERLARLIDFTVSSHPAYSQPQRTLFAFHEYIQPTNFSFSFPFNENCGETTLLAAARRDRPDSDWIEADKARGNLKLKDYDMPELNAWRLAKLYESPISLKGFPSSFYALRDFILHGWLQKTGDAVQLTLEAKKPQNQPTQLLFQARDTLTACSEAATPYSRLGLLSHLRATETEVNGNFAKFFQESQNAFLVESRGKTQKFFDLFSEKSLSLSRVIQTFKEQPGFSLDETNKAMFHLAIFGQGKLTTELKEGGSLIEPLFQLLTRELEELTLHLKKCQDPSALKDLSDFKAEQIKHQEKLLSSYFSMALALFLIYDYCAASGNEEIKKLAQAKKASLQKRLQAWLSERPFEAMQKGEIFATLALTYTASKPKNEEFFRCWYLVSGTEFIPERIDPSLIQQVNRMIYSRITEFVEMDKNPAQVKKILQALLPIEADFDFEGTFPLYVVSSQGKTYEIDLLKGQIWIDKVEQNQKIPFYASAIYERLFGSKRFSGFIRSTIGTIHEGKNQQLYSTIDGDYRFAWSEFQSQLEVEHRINGDWYTFIPDEIPINEQLFISAIPNNSAQMRVWVGDKGMLLEDPESAKTTFIARNGQIKRTGSDKQWTCLNAEEVKGAEDLQAFSQAINFWQSEQHFEIEFPLLRDAEDNLIDFEKKGTRWVWKENPNFFLSPFQNKNSRYLMIEDRHGNKKAFVPIRTVSQIDPICTCECIDLNAQELAPKGIRQTLIAAYFKLEKKEYAKAWEFLRHCSAIEVFTPEEFKILGWIFFQGEETSDFTPEARAISLYAAWLVHENQQRHPDHSYPTTAAKKMNLLSPSEDWPYFWQGTHTWQEKRSFKIIQADFFGSLEVSSNLPSWLRWMKEEHTLHPFERRSWIKALHEKEPDYRFASLLGEEMPSLKYIPNKKVELRPTVENFGVTRSYSSSFSSSYGSSSYGSSSYDNPYSSSYSSAYGSSSVSAQIVQSFDALLQSAKRLRPDQLLSRSFFPLFDIAKGQDKQEKQRLLHFLQDLSFHPDANVQALRLILEATALNLQTLEMINIIASIRTGNPKYDWDKTLTSLITDYEKKKKFLQVTGATRATVSKRLEIAPLPSKPADLMASNFTPLILPPYLDAYFTQQAKPLTHAPFPPLPEHMRSDPFYQRRYAEIVEDWKVGIQKNDGKDAWELKAGVDLVAMKKALQSKLDELRETEAALRAGYELLSQQIDGNPQRQLEAELDALGLITSPLTTAEALTLFTQRDQQLYKKRLPYLSEPNCIKLHQSIGNWLIQATAVQRLERASANPTNAAEFTSIESYDPNEFPQFLVFEYVSNWSLRKGQCENLKKQAKLADRILQMIPGDGKTAVNDPIQALMRADGYHLSLLVPIAPLYDSQAHDISKRSAAIFGQKAHTVRFGRDACFFTLSYLTHLRFTLHRAITEREYLIVPPETLQAMQNKYIEYREIVRAGTQTAEDELCGQELKAILALIRTRGVATLDEVDAIFAPDIELNFPGLHKERIDLEGCEMLSELFWIAASDAEIKELGLRLANNEQSRLPPQNFQKIKELLVHKLAKALADNPRFASIPFEKLIPYLLDIKCPATDLLRDLKKKAPKSAKLVVLLKQMIQEWLPKAWEKSADEHYGRSKVNPSLEIAKPNLAASTPNERAEFADPWETVIKTIHLYIATGVDLQQTKKILSLFTQKARKQWHELGLSSLSETAAGKLFSAAIRTHDNLPVDLAKLDSSNEAVLKAIQIQLNNKSPESLRLVVTYLIESVFPTVKTPTEQIFNHGQSFGSMFLFRQGHSGTIENPYILPDEFEVGKNVELDHGSVGCILDRLLSENKQVTTLNLSTNSPQQLLSRLNIDHKTHAMPDIGAYFKGRSNLSIAQELNQYFALDPKSPIQGILFYNDQANTVNFLRRGHSVARELPNTDPDTIESITGLSKEQLFVYLDHYHRVGVDFKFPSDARAVATLGEQTKLRDLVQGVMRMRELMGNQRIDSFIPQGMEAMVRENTDNQSTPLTIQDEVLFVIVNTLRSEKEENLRATIQKMGDAASRFVLDQLYAQMDPKKEAEIYDLTRDLFVRDLTDKIYETYANPTAELPAPEFLKTLFLKLEQIILKVEPLVSEPDYKKALLKLQKISQGAEKFLAATISAPSSQGSTVENVQQEEAQDEQLALQLAQVQQRSLDFNRNQSAAEERAWDFSNSQVLLSQLAKEKTLPEVFSSLPALKPFTPVFSSSLQITGNFVETAKSEQNLCDQLQKTPHEALFYQHPQTKEKHLLILSSRDAAAFKIEMKKNPATFSFPIALLASDGTTICQGSVPVTVEMSAPLIIQYLFFTGKGTYLGRKPWRAPFLTWLAKDRPIKRDLFISALCPDEQLTHFKDSFLETALYQDGSAAETCESAFRSIELALAHNKPSLIQAHMETLKKKLADFSPDQLLFYLSAAEKMEKQKDSFILAVIPYLHKLDQASIDKIIPPKFHSQNGQLIQAWVELAIKKFEPVQRKIIAENLILSLTPETKPNEFQTAMHALLQLCATVENPDDTVFWKSFANQFSYQFLNQQFATSTALTTLLEICDQLEKDNSPLIPTFKKLMGPFLEGLFGHQEYGCFFIVSEYKAIDMEKFARIKTHIFDRPILAPFGDKFFIDALCKYTGLAETGPNHTVVFNPDKASPKAEQLLNFLNNTKIPYAVERAKEISSRLKIPLSNGAAATSSSSSYSNYR